mmetsp:Transcript_33644/g.74493  ORF Transcript_33644/g.74493 Transcript_33644/m.74493 type:complete len:341 (-) Transcript_33644:611-1633(-)
MAAPSASGASCRASGRPATCTALTAERYMALRSAGPAAASAAVPLARARRRPSAIRRPAGSTSGASAVRATSCSRLSIPQAVQRTAGIAVHSSANMVEDDGTRPAATTAPSSMRSIRVQSPSSGPAGTGTGAGYGATSILSSRPSSAARVSKAGLRDLRGGADLAVTPFVAAAAAVAVTPGTGGRRPGEGSELLSWRGSLHLAARSASSSPMNTTSRHSCADSSARRACWLQVSESPRQRGSSARHRAAARRTSPGTAGLAAPPAAWPATRSARAFSRLGACPFKLVGSAAKAAATASSAASCSAGDANAAAAAAGSALLGALSVPPSLAGACWVPAGCS